MLAIHRRLTLCTVAAILVSVSGCSMGYNFELTCIVTNVVDGKPLPGVKAIVDTFGKKDDLTYGFPASSPTDEEGQLKHTFYVSVGSPNIQEPHRYLKLEKEGFHPEVIDIKPASMPVKAGTTTPIVVEVSMRPKEPLP